MSKNKTLLFWAIAFGLFVLFGLYQYLPYGPYGMHQGAQADRACIGLNYYQESMNFFEPRVMESRNMKGVTGMEFPIIAYASAMIYQLIGYNHLIYRVIEALIFLLGQWAVWQIGSYFITKPLHRALIQIAWISSPILVFYSNNFLPEVPALSFSLMAWHYFFRYYYGIEPKKSAWGFGLFSMLAALLKITYLIPGIAIIILWVIRKKLPFEFIKNPKALLLSWAVGMIPVIGWYTYSKFLTDISYNQHFLQQINPPSSISDFFENTRYALNTWIDSVYPRNFIVLLLLVWLYSLQRNIKQISLIGAISILLFLGFASIFILFNKQYRYHDYYFIQILPFLFFTLLYIYQTQLSQTIIFKGLVGIICAIGLYAAPVINYSHAKNQVRSTYTDGNYYCQNVLNNIWDMEPTRAYINREFGSGEIIVAFDPSPNTMLYYLGRQGIRLAPDFEEILSVGIIQSKLDEKTLAQPYIIINEYFNYPKDHYIHKLIEDKPVFTTGDIRIYKLNKQVFNY